jgi:hypothetical protein
MLVTVATGELLLTICRDDRTCGLYLDERNGAMLAAVPGAVRMCCVLINRCSVGDAEPVSRCCSIDRNSKRMSAESRVV